MVPPGPRDGAGEPFREAGRCRGRPALPPPPGRLLVRAAGHGPGRPARPAGRVRRPRAPRWSSTSTGSSDSGVFIPPGVAHGFASLTDVLLWYLVDNYYNPADELGVAWDDPEIGADWGSHDPVLSARDQANPRRRRARPRPDASLRAAHVSRRRARPDAPGRRVPSDATALTGWTRGAGNRHAGSVDESQQWVEFGRWLAEQREQRGLRRRDAARRAKVSEALWRDLETGRKEAIGAIRLLPNPSADVLERVAGALELPVEDVLARIGRPARPPRAPTAGPATAPRPTTTGHCWRSSCAGCPTRDRAVVERLVDAMLEHRAEHAPRALPAGALRHLLRVPAAPSLGGRATSTVCSKTPSSRSSWPTAWASTTCGRSSTTSSRSTPTPRRPRSSWPRRASAPGASGSDTASCSCRWGSTTPPGWPSASPPSISCPTVGSNSARGSRARGGAGWLRRGPGHQARPVARGAGRRHPAHGGGALRRATRADSCTCRPRNLVPKPLQRPHPPLWVACSRRDTIHLAATLGIGALTFSFVEADEARAWVDDYYATIASEQCVPGRVRGEPQPGVRAAAHVSRGRVRWPSSAGLDGSHFFGYSLAHYYVFGDHEPGVDRRVGGVPGEPRPLRVQPRRGGPDRASAGGPAHGAGPRSLRGAIGTPVADPDAGARVRSRRRRSADLREPGRAATATRTSASRSSSSRARSCPSSTSAPTAIERVKAERLAPAIAAALARRDPPAPRAAVCAFPAMPTTLPAARERANGTSVVERVLRWAWRPRARASGAMPAETAPQSVADTQMPSSFD